MPGTPSRMRKERGRQPSGIRRRHDTIVFSGLLEDDPDGLSSLFVQGRPDQHGKEIRRFYILVRIIVWRILKEKPYVGPARRPYHWLQDPVVEESLSLPDSRMRILAMRRLARAANGTANSPSDSTRDHQANQNVSSRASASALRVPDVDPSGGCPVAEIAGGDPRGSRRSWSPAPISKPLHLMKSACMHSLPRSKLDGWQCRVSTKF